VRVVRSTIAIGLSLAGVACGLTLVYLSMRAVMDVGGFCAEGGPFVIEQHCPQGVPGVMVGSLLGGIVLAFVYVGVAVWRGIPSFAGLLWPALFLSLGTREQKRPSGWPAGMPLAQMQRVAARVQPSMAPGAGMVDELERLAKLHERGALSDDEYVAAKARLL
jgi:Short C-terminal domain